MPNSNPTTRTAIELEVGSHRVTFEPSHWPAMQDMVNAAIAAPDTGYHQADTRTRIRAKASSIRMTSPLRAKTTNP
jgi:hypothetical protein